MKGRSSSNCSRCSRMLRAAVTMRKEERKRAVARKLVRRFPLNKCGVTQWNDFLDQTLDSDCLTDCLSASTLVVANSKQ